MNLEKAKKVIRDDNAGVPAWMLASAVISSPENQDISTYEDLLQCLRREGSCAGNAALALYSRTNRPGGANFETFSRSLEDWQSYLHEHRFV